MDSKKIILAISFIVFVIIIGIILTLLIIQKPQTDNVVPTNTIQTEPIQQEQPVTISKIKYFAIANCLQRYVQELNLNNSKYYEQDENGNEVKSVEDEYIKEEILKYISDEYIKENNITTKNIDQYVKTYNTNVFFIPTKMKCIQSGEDIERYIVQGYTEEVITYSNLQTINLVVNLDLNNKTFSIEPLSDTYKTIEDIKVKERKIAQIEEKTSNTFSYTNITDVYLIKQYLNTYKRLALASPEVAYKYLNKEYRDARFGSVENYKQYVEKNRNNIIPETLLKYKKYSDYDEYTQYIAITKSENYYIFREKDTMELEILLDTFTIAIPEYEEKYNEANNQQKTAYCIDRFIKILNSENYTLAYKLLATSFKNNYFKTQESFEQYAKQNLANKEVSSYVEFKNEGELYCTYSVTLQENGQDTNEVDKTFIVKLGEGTDFELSFNVDN